MQPTIYFASDHAGFELKNELISFVKDTYGYEVVDCGAYVYEEQDDFTDFVAKAVREVSAHPVDSKAIILGGSGQGEAMLANRFHGVRAVVYYGGNQEIVKLSREHNDANVLSLGARFVSVEEAKRAVELWFNTPHVPVLKYDRRNSEIEEFSTEAKSLTPNTLVRSLVPSLPAESFSEIAALLDTLEGVSSGMQVDIVDGVFVPFVSWPFTEPDPLDALQQLSAYKDFDIEVDCMCMNPQMYLDTFVSLGVARVIVHAGTTENYVECFDHAKRHGYKIGLGILNTTSRELLATYVHEIDFVQVMGIAHIGVQGQPFDAQTLDTVAYIRSAYPSLEIAVDGSVNESTIPLLLKAGANRFAPGSAIASSSNPVVAYKHLADLVLS